MYQVLVGSYFSTSCRSEKTSWRRHDGSSSTRDHQHRHHRAAEGKRMRRGATQTELRHVSLRMVDILICGSKRRRVVLFLSSQELQQGAARRF